MVNPNHPSPPVSPYADANQVVAQAYRLVGTSYQPNHCLQFVRTLWGAQGMGGNPNQSFTKIPPDLIHSDQQPPVGAPIWMTGGAGTDGHIALVSKYVNGVPYVITTDYPKVGKIGEVPLSTLIHAFGNLQYRGWSTSINNKPILTGASHPSGDGGVPSVTTATNSATGSATDSATTTGTGAVAYKPATTQDVLNSIQADFGLTNNLLSMDPSTGKFSLTWAFNKIQQDGITDSTLAANVLAQTTWFQTYGTQAISRLASEANKSGDFKEGVRQSLAGLKDTLANSGITLSSKDLNALARDAYVYGFSTSQILDTATADKSAAYSGGGTTGQALAGLDSTANLNGVTLSSTDRAAWSRDIANGNKTPMDFEKVIRDRAAAQYSVFGDKIKAGDNLHDLTAPYRDVASKLLEVAPEAISWNDPLFKDGKAFQTVDPKSGQMVTKPLWDFRKEVQADPRWQQTDNAKTTYTDFGAGILKRFGVMA